MANVKYGTSPAASGATAATLETINGDDLVGDFEDIIFGNAGLDTIDGETGNDILFGGGGIDALIGGTGNDVLNGEAGDDDMKGGAGNDVYFVGSASDTLSELTATSVDSGGIDTVVSLITSAASTYTLPSVSLGKFENLVLGFGAINGTGNELANRIIGNSGANILTSGSGTLGDNLIGGAGTDTLRGGAGNDTLNGGAADDTLIGGAGNDIYIVTSTDTLSGELSTGGTDTVQFAGSASLESFTLENFVENITLTGTNAVDATASGSVTNHMLTGNSANNSITGGDANDTLVGGAATSANSLTGGNGNDTYIIINAADSITETATGGTDAVQFGGTSGTYTIAAGIENVSLTGLSAINASGSVSGSVVTTSLTITGNGAINTLTGGSNADVINGGANNDILTGAAGADKLAGGAGIDKYVISATAQTATPASAWTAAATGSKVSTTGMDIITVTNTDNDTLDLSAIAASLGSVTAVITTITGSTSFTAAGTGTAVQTWLGTYSSAANIFTSKSTGTDTLLVYDNNGSTGAGALEAIVLVGAATALTVAAGVFTI